jgi:hypothetical protein
MKLLHRRNYLQTGSLQMNSCHAIHIIIMVYNFRDDMGQSLVQNQPPEATGITQKTEANGTKKESRRSERHH